MSGKHSKQSLTSSTNTSPSNPRHVTRATVVSGRSGGDKMDCYGVKGLCFPDTSHILTGSRLRDHDFLVETAIQNPHSRHTESIAIISFESSSGTSTSSNCIPFNKDISLCFLLPTGSTILYYYPHSSISILRER